MKTYPFLLHRSFMLGMVFAALLALPACEDDEDDTSDPQNQAPTADLTGPQSTVATGETISFDANGSTDPDGDNLSYSWSLQGPSGSSAQLANTSGATNTLSPDVQGDYVVTVTVSDGNGGSDQASLTISASAGEVIEISSDVSSDATWSSDNVYRVLNYISINGGAILTIEPGTRVEFESQTGISINDGALVAEGTAQDSITMTGTEATPGHWTGLGFFSGNAANSLDFVTLEYAGNTGGWTFINEAASIGLDAAARVSIRNCLVRFGGAFGLQADDGAQIDAFENNRFAQHNEAPVSISANLMGVLDGGSSFSDNDDPFIRVNAGSISDLTTTINALDVSYRINGTIGINGGSEVTVAAGTNMEVNSDGGIRVDGDDTWLSVEGTSSDPVTITGVQQPTSGGFWAGIAYFSGNSNNLLEHTIIEYGGSSGYTFLNEVCAVGMDASGRLSMRNVTIRNSGSYGFHADGGATIDDFQENTFEDNDDAPVNIPMTLILEMDGASDFANNSESYVRISGGDLNDETGTINALNVPYQIDQSIFISGGSEVTVEAGSKFQFNSGTLLSINDNTTWLSIEGTANNKVEITGVSETADGGTWNGLGYFTNNPNNSIDHAIIEYGGADNFTFISEPANIGIDAGARLSVSNTALNFSGGWGLWADDGMSANVTLTNVTFDGNDDGEQNVQ